MATHTYASGLKHLRSLLRITPEPASAPEATSNYLYGLRGVLAILSFLWIFFDTFVPGVVQSGAEAPPYQNVIRIVFSPLLWNPQLLQSFFFALSARSICQRFLKDPTSASYGGSIIRRIIRIPLAVGIASAIASGIFMALGNGYVSDFKHELPNNAISEPGVPENGLVFVNAIFDTFWVVRSYFYQAANDFWPSRTLWAISLVYQQSWTIYFLMVILPFTRATWHLPALAIFAAGSFWMCSWGWYDATALLLADYVTNKELRQHLEGGMKVTEDTRLPWVVPATLMMAIGTALKYVWTALPQYIDSELVLHPFLDLSENTTRAHFAAADPYPRLDNYLVIFGVLLLVETTPIVQRLLSHRSLVQIGKRSFSLFVVQSIFMYTAGIKLFMHLHVSGGTNKQLSNLAVFVTGILGTAVFAELYYRLVDLPSQWLSRAAYKWLTI